MSRTAEEEGGEGREEREEGRGGEGRGGEGRGGGRIVINVCTCINLQYIFYESRK